MKPNIQRMRETFAHAAERMGWPPADIAEFNADIKRAVHLPDPERLAWWGGYLEQASNLAALAKQCRALEARIKADAQKRKDAACLISA